MAGSDALTRVVIADAGPLIALSRADQLSLLRGLFGQVEITDQIRTEVLESGAFPGQVAIDEALREGWLRCHTIELTAWRPLCPGVDAGEASALLLAMQHLAPLLIMDDRAGRAEARARGLSVMGVAAVVGLAKQQGLISAAAPVLARMRANGYFIGHDVIAAVLARIGESAVPTPPGP
jgi:predicted nucleic acid-binding protein